MMPIATPMKMPTPSAMRAEHERVGHRRLELGPHRSVALDRVAPVEADEVPQPAEVLLEDAAVEAVGVLVLLDLLLGRPRVEAQVAGHRIGADADGHEHEERDDEQRGDRPQRSSSDEAQHEPSPSPGRESNGERGRPTPSPAHITSVWNEVPARSVGHGHFGFTGDELRLATYVPPPVVFHTRGQHLERRRPDASTTSWRTR